MALHPEAKVVDMYGTIPGRFSSGVRGAGRCTDLQYEEPGEVCAYGSDCSANSVAKKVWNRVFPLLCQAECLLFGGYSIFL